MMYKSIRNEHITNSNRFIFPDLLGKSGNSSMNSILLFDTIQKMHLRAIFIKVIKIQNVYFIF